MSKYLHATWENDELKKLNDFIKQGNNVMESIEYPSSSIDGLTIHLVGGGFIYLSTLGGIEVEELKESK